MSRTRWIVFPAVAGVVPLMVIAGGAVPAAAQAAPDGGTLRPAGVALTVSAPAGAARSNNRAPAADSPLRVTQACDPATIAVKQSTTCTITAKNIGTANTTVDLGTASSVNLFLTGATGATVTTPFTAKAPRATLDGTRAGGPVSVAPDPGTLFGYLPLAAFGATVIPLGDEQLSNLDVPGFVFNDTTYTRLGISSNGYLVPGGGEAGDQAEPGAVPDPVRPNSVIAPFWADLDGTGTTGAQAAVLTDGVSSWIVVEWQVNVHGTGDLKVFQAWLGVNGTQDIQYAYKFDTITDPGVPFVVGAENATGTTGARLPAGVLPSQDLRVTSTSTVPGGEVSYTVTMKGLVRGPGQVTTLVRSPILAKPFTVSTPVTVTKP
ncbi:hypothetical protein [Actinoplanes sp. GCM10030250]|uniref:hypothetical protein n=1 Tax=Actinoplanes sp. GCM10030250 TaxID=3273376 RepID=UPI0036120389